MHILVLCCFFAYCVSSFVGRRGFVRADLSRKATRSSDSSGKNSNEPRLQGYLCLGGGILRNIQAQNFALVT